MTRSAEKNTYLILKVLADEPIKGQWNPNLKGPQLSEATGSTPPEINEAATILVDSELADWQQYKGTSPYRFGEICITARGRYEYERLTKVTKIDEREKNLNIHPPSPVGSPYGFYDQDWEVVSERKADTSTLFIVFGYQFKSKHYNTKILVDNIKNTFEQAVNNYKNEQTLLDFSLDFRPLSAGYGEHLFNEIARDIISSDIAVFDTSDLNPNVMIEMGVALTWGVRLLPIKDKSCPKPPSDISGQTWANYSDSASKFDDNSHNKKLMSMIGRAIKKKVGRY